MSSELQSKIRAAKRRREMAELLRKRKEQNEASTFAMSTHQPCTTKVESSKVVNFQTEEDIAARGKASSLKDMTMGTRGSSFDERMQSVDMSTKKRSRTWESPQSSSNRKIDDSRRQDDDRIPQKSSSSSTRIYRKSRLSLSDSSDDDGESSCKVPPTSSLLPKEGRYSSVNSDIRQGDSARIPVMVRPLHSYTNAAAAADDSDSDDSTLRARRLLRRQGATSETVKKATISVKKDQPTPLHPPTNRKMRSCSLSDDSMEESEQKLPAHAKEESPTENQPSPSEFLKRSQRQDSSSSSSEDSEIEIRDRQRSTGVPRNPLALQKQKDEEFKATLAKLPPRRPTGNYCDGLSDSDPEPASDEERKKAASKKKRRSSSLSGKRKTKSSSSNTKQRLGRAYDGFWEYCNVLDARGSLLLDYSERSLAEQLHPDGLVNRVFVNMALKSFVLENGDPRYEVPASLARYLADFQREGIQFMFNCLRENMGCILADDMGLGKTLQVLCLLSALFKKSGTGLDVLKMKHRQQLVKTAVEEQQQKEHEALMRGMLDHSIQNTNLGRERIQELDLPERWWPVLIAVPPSVLTNWEQEIDKWTNLSFAVYSDQNTREKAISQITSGMAEVMLIKNSCFTVKERFRELCAIPVRWKLIVFDEFHTFKNKDATAVANIRELKSLNHSLVVGMSGTVMQNNHQELWTLVDLVETNFLGDWNDFKYEVADPIKLGRAKSATPELISVSDAKANALQRKLRKIMIERKKEHVLKEFLPSKREKVVMCHLSSMQKEVYAHILKLPEIDYVRKASSPCDCDVNRAFFQHLNRLAHQSARVAYVREQQVNLVKRRDCCYEVPMNPRYVDGGSEPRIHPDAVIWRSMKGHAGDKTCDQCPFCCGFPVLAKLYKLGNHLALLQAKKTNNADEEGHPDNIEYIKQMAFAKVALPGVAEKLSGGYILKDGIMDDHFALSGKLKVLDTLLAKFWNENAKALLFSYSTQTLDLVENFLKAKGQYIYLRMDGSTDSRHRQGLADEFNNNPTKFLFLLSTKAMGVGLNLTAASKVVIFDVEWNPSNDEQAQDRAYRIGQKQDVEVFRLVAQGTIDEMKYLRQLYKVQLKQETFAEKSSEPQAARIFKGVEGDKHRKGELFGYENLFRFKDGSFLTDIWKASGKNISTRRSDDLVIHDASKISDALLGFEAAELCGILDGEGPVDRSPKSAAAASIPDDYAKAQVKKENDHRFIDPYPDNSRSTKTKEDASEVEAFDHGDFFRDDRGGAALEQGDEGYDEEMGGQTQNVFEIFERGGVLGDENPQDGSADFEASQEEDSSVVVERDGAMAMGDDVSAIDESIPEHETAVVIDQLRRAPRVLREPTISHNMPSSRKPYEVETVEESSTSMVNAVAGQDLKKEADGPKSHHKRKAKNPDSIDIGDTVMPRFPDSTVDVEDDTNVNGVGPPTSNRLGPLVAPNVNLFGIASSNQRDTTTNFSTDDLFLPTYMKSSKKKKKK